MRSSFTCEPLRERPSSTSIQFTPTPLELRVRARHLAVPVEHDVVAGDAADRDPVALAELGQAQVAHPVAVDEERRAATFGVEDRHLLDRRE